jgi:single-strand DNA-binding protein
MNIVVLSGSLLSVPTCREQPSGTCIWALDVVTQLEEPTASAAGVEHQRVSVPVVWSCDAVPPSWAAATEVVVAGVVRRRFFRTGGATQSRTEVVAATVVEVTKRRPLARAVDRALASLGPGDQATLRSAAG